MAITGFKDKEAMRIFRGSMSNRLPRQIQQRARMKLLQLHAAVRLDDLRVPPSNLLELLSGDRRGLHSVRINDQFRICFNWNGGNVVDVEIVDYH